MRQRFGRSGTRIWRPRASGGAARGGSAPVARVERHNGHLLQSPGTGRGSRLQGGSGTCGTAVGAAETLREDIGLSLGHYERSHYDYEGRLAAARKQLDEATWEAAWAEGRAMPPEQAIEYALSKEEEPSPPSPPPKKDAAGLSARELEVLGLVAEGLTDSQVAERIYLSPRTVNHHLSSIYRKLGLPSRAAATKEAGKRGLI